MILLSLILAAAPVVREARAVYVNGAKEVWRLEWQREPKPVCADEDALASCPCAGFVHGASGPLDLVRLRQGMPEQRLHLGPLFADRDSPADPDDAVVPGGALLLVGDYDHDGSESEIVLQLSNASCGHQPSVLVGVSRDRDELHVFSAQEAPAVPLVLERKISWERLRRHGRVASTELGCGDHASEQKIVVSIWTDALGLHSEKHTARCPKLR
jgi:hypothetical protein